MATNAIAGFGFQVLIGDGQTVEAFVPVAEVFEAGDFISPQSLLEDASHFGTALTGKDEISVGQEMDAFEFGINYIAGDSTHDHVNGLIADQLSGTLRNFRIKIPGPDQVGVTMAARVRKVAIQTFSRRSIVRATVTLNPQLWEMVDASGW